MLSIQRFVQLYADRVGLLALGLGIDSAVEIRGHRRDATVRDKTT
ncbi:hypothetical protein [Natrinema gelatinilyticum]|nr:hypothetical protein [Natrinema gelatinilyticum]